MRARGVVVLAGLVSVVLVSGLVAGFLLTRKNEPGPEKVSADYFKAWQNGSFGTMQRLVSDPPADFADQHRALSRSLLVSSVELSPGPLVRVGSDQAHVDYTADRQLAGHGSWKQRSTLRLGKVKGHWRVLWTPAVFYPGLKARPAWKLRQVDVPPVKFVARDGKDLPAGGSLEPYVSELSTRIGLDDEDEDAETTTWVVEVSDGGRPAQRVTTLSSAKSKKIRTTVDRKVQAAAEKAVAGSSRNAVVVALRPSTGEILGIGDRLGGRGAFLGTYPPGSSFKVVTAAALLGDGMGVNAGAECPATVVTAQRTINNHDGESVGHASLRDAFAQSCNTTFARLAVERLKAGKMSAAAEEFGFGRPITPGVSAERGSYPEPGSGAELAESAIGQGRVEASPLMMAVVAAAVEDGTWRSPRMVDAKLIRETGDPIRPPHDIANADGLRSMMRAVVERGTAARAGLPSGTAGKTGTAEFGTGGHAHAWFIGYRDDLAFSVFVEAGESGPKVAAPLAAAFLRNMR
ncbi:hypothetical protein J4573_36035 [Actinomadura barringtoniae]|uniref:Cell division protein FtsI n=1 Tax=Actinomadura barringtoniae TaxID=1427535 RepID=A0A939PI02_9ACTN|nr:penicillin-binding transpeptidase domain-containing protein [Actinomadura barringtoniae]MBO2452548.1 hypothetical protein [Actinomadura barringtoniae]